ncbi:MAG: hypothetical protein AB1485_00205 [Candidatus Thermoplasmatota archaeon]
MILKTSYRQDCAKALTEYISRRRHLDIRDRNGNVMSQEEIDRFIDKSEKHNFEREFIISPDDHEIAVDNMINYTREGMEQWIAESNRESVDYIYCVHYDTLHHPHVHVAMIGRAKDLRMYKSEIQHAQDMVFAKAFKEPELHKGLYLTNPLREKEEELEMMIGL